MPMSTRTSDHQTQPLQYAGQAPEQEVDEKQYDASSDASTLSTSAAIDFRPDDVDLITDLSDEECPANTLRMWIMLFGFGTLLGGVDALFQMRYPTVSVGEIVAVVIAWPIGMAWYKCLPNWSFPFFGRRIELNPGPFNRKEMACILMFVNVCTKTNLTDTLMVEQIKYFDLSVGFGRFCFFNFVTYLLGWGWAGLGHSVLVQPASMTWPGVLGQVALVTTFDSYHRKGIDEEPKTSWKISRLAMFGSVFGFSFVWYWISGFIFPALADVGAFISWAAPNNATLGQVFGVQTGMGLFPLALDWSMLSNLSNPLLTPFWAASCMFGSFVVWGWIVLPAIYYSNTWHTAHFPLMSKKLFTAEGKTYDFTKVVTSNWRLDHAAYHEYSPLMLPAAFVLNAGLGVASFVAVFVHCILHWREDIWIPIRDRNKHTDRHSVLMQNYKGVNYLWYLASSIVGLVMGIIYCQVWRDKVQIGGGGFVVSLLICAVFFLPIALIEARTSFMINLGNFLEMISSFWLKEQPISAMYFSVFGYSALQHALHQAQSAKMGHYLKVPKRLTAVVLFVAGIWSSLVATSVTYFVLHHTENVCTSKASNNFNCRKASVSFNSHVAWGLLGSKLFATGGRYVEIYYFIIPAVLACLLIWGMARRYPNSSWKYVNPVLLMNSGTMLPSNTGVNFSAWFVVVFIFGYLIHKKRTGWWRKYNMIIAVALDTGVAIAVILIYFCITYTGAASNFSWWGTEVTSKGCDSKGCPHLPVSSLHVPSGW